MYLVSAVHNTGHGHTTSTVLVTNDAVKALQIARSAESRGYQFLDDEACVTIVQLSSEHVYGKQDHDIVGDLAPKGHPAIFIRGKRDGQWFEKWFQPKLQAKFEGTEVRDQAA